MRRIAGCGEEIECVQVCAPPISRSESPPCDSKPNRMGATSGKYSGVSDETKLEQFL